jgi:hypothetical protein
LGLEALELAPGRQPEWWWGLRMVLGKVASGLGWWLIGPPSIPAHQVYYLRQALAFEDQGSGEITSPRP